METKGVGVIRSMRDGLCLFLPVVVVVLASRQYATGLGRPAEPAEAQRLGSIQGKSLSVVINSDGSYSIASTVVPGTVLRSNVEADVNSKALQSSGFPQHKTAQSEFHDEFGSGKKLTVTHTGLPGKPDLVCT